MVFLPILAAVLGVVALVALYASGPLLASLVGNSDTGKAEFSPGKFSSTVWVLESVALVLAVVYLYSANAKATFVRGLRPFLLIICWIALGGMALCDLVAVPTLFARHS